MIGRTEMEDALKKLDRLTLEEARMWSAQVLKLTHAVDDRVKAVGHIVEDIDDKVVSDSVDDQVARIDDRVAGVDDRITGVDARVAAVDNQVASVNERVVTVDDRVKMVDNNLMQVIARA